MDMRRWEGGGRGITMALLRAVLTASEKLSLVTLITAASRGYPFGSSVSSEMPCGMSTLKSGSVGWSVRETLRLPPSQSDTTSDDAYRLSLIHI